jgi:hypothetical protein
MQMVQNKKMSAGLALIAGLLGMCVSEAALALPEVEVGSRLTAIATPQSIESDDAAVPAEADTIVSDENAQSPSN